MSGTSTANEAGRYEIRIHGHLEDRWTTWFDGLTLTTCGDGTTVIHGQVTDQAALHGLLRKVRDMGLPLVSVIRVDAETPTSDGVPTTTQPSTTGRTT